MGIIFLLLIFMGKIIGNYWYEFNDAIINNVGSELKSYSDAYTLFYIKDL